MRTTRHIWRSADGRLVADGDPAAAFLAVPAGTEVSEDVARMFGAVDDDELKQAGQPANKQATPAANKGR